MHVHSLFDSMAPADPTDAVVTDRSIRRLAKNQRRHAEIHRFAPDDKGRTDSQYSGVTPLLQTDYKRHGSIRMRRSFYTELA